MQTKILDDVVTSIAGKSAVSIVDLLYGKKNVNEFLIAKKQSLTINQTRNILYKLSDSGLVSFIRRKDKRKGWYTYFWTLNLGRVYGLMEDTINKEINNLRFQLKSRKEKRFYFCKTCHVEVSEETALLHDFVCKECGEVYELNTDIKILKELENKIVRLEREMKGIEIELDKLRIKKIKKIEKEVKKDKVDRAKKRKEKKEAKEKAEKKLEKKSRKKRKKKVKKKLKKKVKKKIKKKK